MTYTLELTKEEATALAWLISELEAAGEKNAGEIDGEIGTLSEKLAVLIN